MPYRTILAAMLLAMALQTVCAAQTYTDYSILSSTNNLPSGSNWQGSNVWAVDVNNDGIPDLIQQGFSGDYLGAPAVQFTISIANGDGTFRPPVAYNYPPGLYDGVPIAFGDFNGDGRIDLAMWGGYTTVAIFLGNGDGTFKNPWYSNVLLASGQYISTVGPFAVADFNHDGHADLAIVGTCSCASTNTTLYILPGNGTGLFSAAIPIHNEPNSESTLSEMNSILVGDFDSDGNADLAVTVGNYDGHLGAVTSSTVHVLYGNGNLDFEDTTPIVNADVSSINAGDLNSDGDTDLFVLNSNLQTYYGQPDRTFTSYTQQIPGWFYFSTQAMPYPAMADLNDDGHMDLVLEAHDYTNDGFLVFLLARPDPGQFDYQTWNLPASNLGSPGYSALAAGDFNGDSKPDWINHLYTDPGYSSAPQSVTTGLNATSGGNWSNCNYPSSERGIALCSPAGTSTSAVNISATARSFGQLRKMEVWVDGNKLNEQHHTWGSNAYMNYSTSSLASGVHKGTIYAADVDNTLQRLDFNFTVGPSNCSAPASDGVNICSPTSGTATSATPVLVQATAKIEGTLARMEIWIDGEKKFTETDSTSLAAAINLKPGTHQFTVYAVNTDGTLWDQTVGAIVP